MSLARGSAPGWRWGIYLLLLLLPLGLRLVDLTADPPLDVAFLHAFASDEGFYSYHARQVVLFGQPPPGDFWDNRHVSPLFDLLAERAFRLFGVGLWSLRIPQVLFGVATVALLYDLLRRGAGPGAARWGALFLSWNYVLFVYQRVGMFYSLLVLLCSACAWAWLRGREVPSWQLLSGVSAGLALAVSPFSLLFLAGLALAPLLGQRRPAGGHPIGTPGGNAAEGLAQQGTSWWVPRLLWLAGLLLVLAIYLGLYLLPHRALVVRDVGRSGGLPFYSSPWQVLANLFLFFYAPVFVLNLLPLCGVCLLTGAALRRWRGGAAPSPLEGLLLSWFWTGAAGLALINYRPTRYFLYLLVPLCAALALVVTRWQEVVDLPQGAFLWPAIPLVAVAGLVLRDLLGPQRYQGTVLWWAAVGVSWAAAFLPGILRGLPRVRAVLRSMGTVLAVLCLLADGAFLLSAWSLRQHTLAQVSAELGLQLPREALLLRGCTLTLENELHCLPLIDPAEVDPAALAGYRLFYFTEEPDLGRPEDRLWGTWHILDRDVRLYELDPTVPGLDGVEMSQF